MTRDLPTAARELLNVLNLERGRLADRRTPHDTLDQAQIELERALRAHHETHRSREIHPLALAVIKASADYQLGDGDEESGERCDKAGAEWAAARCPIYAAPDPHHEADADSLMPNLRAYQRTKHHEADAALVDVREIAAIAHDHRCTCDGGIGRMPKCPATMMMEDIDSALAEAPARLVVPPDPPVYGPSVEATARRET